MSGSVLFLGLATYSRVGGLQNFNRRLLSNLGALVDDGVLGSVSAHLMDDRALDVPEIERIEIEGFGGNKAGFIWRLLQRLRRIDDLLVGHINLLPVAWAAKRLRPGLRITLFVHGDDVWNDELRRRRPGERWMLRSIDRVAAVSNFTARTMAKEYEVPVDRFVLFPNVIDDFDLPEERPLRHCEVVLCVTRLGTGDRRKNVAQLIRAVAGLRDKGRSIQLVIVGDGALRPELEDLASRLGLADQVTFKGRVSDDDLNEAYEAADIFALPSSKEGFGIVYLEAWSRGLPVICGRKGAPCEIIEDGVDGLVVNEDDPIDIAQKVEFLLDNSKAAAEMGRRGLQKTRELYLNAAALENTRRLIAGTL